MLKNRENITNAKNVWKVIFFQKKNSSCTTDTNCFSGNKDTGICQTCKNGYYIDYKDGKCKSNQEENDYKYCKIADDICIECLDKYYIGMTINAPRHKIVQNLKMEYV